MEIRRGDIFCTRNPMMLGRAINAMQKFWSTDGQSTYSHAGIFTTNFGDTFESLWTIKHSHIANYIGQQVLIGRLSEKYNTKKNPAIIDTIRKHKGQLYPFWRLPMHMFPPLAKYLHFTDHPVCSELTMKYVRLCGVSHVGQWAGKNPDHVADFIHNDKECDVIFEGLLTEELVQEWGD